MKKLVAVIGIVGLAWVGWRWHGHAAPPQPDKLIVDRLWIDHLPRTERDTINAFVALTEQPFGAFQSASRWQGAYELFTYERVGGELRTVFPQTGSKETFHAKATECRAGAMDYCLELSGGKHGVQRYYSMKGWEIDSAAAEQDLLARVTR